MPKKKKQKTKKSIVPKAKAKFKLPYSIIAKKELYLALLGFILFAVILYHQCLTYGYVLDDKIVLSENNYVKKGLAGISDIFSKDSFQGYFGEQLNLLEGGRYRPLSLATFAIEYEFFGLNSSISHLINVILYGLCGFIVFITLHQLFKEKLGDKKFYYAFSFIVACLFLIHPVHVEAVANIKGRDEILSFIFSMLSLKMALNYIDKKSILSFLLCLVSFFLGLLSKENTITFLAIIPFAIWLFRKDKLKQTGTITLFILITTIIYLAIRYSIMGYLLGQNESVDLMNNPFVGMDGVTKYATIFYTLLEYLKLNITPFELTHDYYPYHIPVSSFGDIKVIFSLLINFSLIGLAFYNIKKNRLITFGIGFYFIALTIVSNIVVNVGTFMNERFIFTASMGMCVLLVLAMERLISFFYPNKNDSFTIVALTPLLILFGMQSFSRVPAWENELTLNKTAIKVSKNSARANSFMATALFNQYQASTDNEEKKRLIYEAEPFAKKAVEIHPVYKNGYIMMSGIAAEQYKYDQDLDKLLGTFKRIIQKRPDIDYIGTYLKFLNKKDVYDEKLIPFYIDVGKKMLHDQQKNYTWAIHYLLIGLETDANNIELRKALVQAYTSAGRPQDADRFR